MDKRLFDLINVQERSSKVGAQARAQSRQTKKKGGLSTTPQGALSNIRRGEPSMIWGPIHLTEAPREEGRSANIQRLFSSWRASFAKSLQNKYLRRFSEICDKRRQVRTVCLGRQEPNFSISVCFYYIFLVVLWRHFGALQQHFRGTFTPAARSNVAQRRRRRSVLLGLEMRGFEAVTLQKFVELRAIAAGQLGGLGHVALRELENAGEVVVFKALAGVFK